jgi:hypothetical protein
MVIVLVLNGFCTRCLLQELLRDADTAIAFAAPVMLHLQATQTL